ncbi:putative baseplate assembly protein [Andreprevotia lacus DSM 23236]|jgi:hypothetical protein|uniref:Putative baseplate assembly protein n=1 Tax=Andreprevotia lacus DSM 23236 TaxID=1121001 RepID=A0A1W1X789_9NEIS|nr:hypothetical protein [Andreprevotia lacus]SMC19684.1 putative baseplate assembly protein [Andreprevotia lacus DSM 23236]
MSCACDSHVFPQPRAIPAALASAFFRPAHAPGLFGDWRNALLADIGRSPALRDWRARDGHDFGLMLVEMGAYVFDVLGFYDALVAGESYLHTASLSGAQRRLVGLLGYRPRPAVAAIAQLAAEADGKQPVQLPKGTAFRSSAFAGEPPQIFELDAATGIDPRINALPVAKVRATTLPASFDSLLVDPASVRVRAGDAVVLDINGQLYARRISTVSTEVQRTPPNLSRIGLSSSVSPASGATYAQLRILAGGATTSLWQLTPGSGEGNAASGSQIALNVIAPIYSGQIVLIEQGTSLDARHVSSIAEAQRTVLSSLSSTITDSASHTSTLTSPAIKRGSTTLTLDSAPSFTLDVSKASVHYALYPAAQVLAPVLDTLGQTDPVGLPALRDAPRVTLHGVLLQDANDDGVSTQGSLDAANHSATLDATPAWGKTLAAPVTLFGNVLQISRGESVHGEVLGTGDGAQASQSFKLQKKPLTYLPANNASGMVSTLAVWVGGVQWHEVDTFYGVDAHAQVYTVRQDDAGDSHVTFGGGARLPTGAVVSADYRHGAGAAVPPAGLIKQLAKPVAGLRRVHNVLPAYGGADAESSAELAVYAPQSALLLGRAISLPDLEAAASQVAGVRAVRASWRWDAAGLRPAAVIGYIGDQQLASTITSRLRALSELDAPLRVEQALPQTARLALAVLVDPDHSPSQVKAAVLLALYAPVTLPGTGGFLRAERLGPDGPVFVSQLMAVVMAVPGVIGVQSLTFNEGPFTQPARVPNAGHYFDFGSGGVLVNGTAASEGVPA